MPSSLSSFPRRGPALRTSILSCSALARTAMVAPLLVLLWAAVAWAWGAPA